MLLGIIRNETANEDYYINLNIENNINKLCIQHVTNQGIKFLSKKQAIELLKLLLSSKLTYKEKENDYDVYRDEANNRRYFKDGKENYFKFIENNGIDAAMYLTKISKKPSYKIQKIIVGSLAFTITISALPLLHLANKIEYEEPLYELIRIEPITVKDLVNNIEESPYISNEDKEILANKVYLEFVLRNAKTPIRRYNLELGFKNINIEFFSKEEEENAAGYFVGSTPNTIHILNSIEKGTNYYKNVIAHEYIHLTQDSINRYIYIREACAVIMVNEFFDNPGNVYNALVERVKILMEIIGPQPIIDCNFKGDPTSFEESIKKYLSEDEANELLDLFSKANCSKVEETKIQNERIDELLSKMYTNKIGKSIKDDKLITQIKNQSIYDRIYFNPNHEQYNKDTVLGSKRPVIAKKKIEEVINSDIVKDYLFIYHRKVGGINSNFEIKTYRSTTDFNSMPLKENNMDIYYVSITLKDGNYATVSYNHKTNKWNDVKFWGDPVEECEPSIAKKFPDQAQEKIIFDDSKDYNDVAKKLM